ncbi:MAG TPA: hypothetical protein VLK85_19430 [Ramlibacter sp.]|nr:hypothetical protein [Ramlibacter sp.]
MHLLQDPPEGFDGIARAFTTARQLSAGLHRAVKIGLARGGVVFAVGELQLWPGPR